MGAETAALAFAAASTAIAGGSFLAGQSAAKSQYKLDAASIELAREQARTQAAESAQQNALGFRKALASQVALASMRGGSGSLVRQFGAESYSNFLKDQAAIDRGVRVSDAQSLTALAQAKANRYVAGVKGITDFGQAALSAWNLNTLKEAGLISKSKK